MFRLNFRLEFGYRIGYNISPSIPHTRKRRIVWKSKARFCSIMERWMTIYWYIWTQQMRKRNSYKCKVLTKGISLVSIQIEIWIPYCVHEQSDISILDIHLQILLWIKLPFRHTRVLFCIIPSYPYIVCVHLDNICSA